MTIGFRMAEELLNQTKAMYDGVLDIADELILVDARHVKSEGMTKFRNILKRLRTEIIVSYVYHNNKYAFVFVFLFVI